MTEYGDENNPQTKEKIISLAYKYGKLKPNDDWVRVFAAFDGIVIYKFEAIKGARYITYKMIINFFVMCFLACIPKGGMATWK